MGDPVHKTILLLDIEKFGPRLHLEQAEAQRVLYSVLAQVLSRAGIEHTKPRTEDRGDGVFVLIGAGTPKLGLLRALLTQLPTALYDYNRLASEAAQVRMRAVLHAGDVEITSKGAVGPPIVEAFRLLNSDELKAELAKSTEPSVLCVSELIHHEVVRHDHSGIRADRFHPLAANVKEGLMTAWVHSPAGTSDPADQAPPTTEAARPSIQATSGKFFGGTVTVSGDVVGGNKTIHGSDR